MRRRWWMRAPLTILAVVVAVVGSTVGAIAGSPATPGASPTAGGLAGRLDAVVAGSVETGAFAGSVLVARGDEVLLANGYGAATRTPETPNTAQTTFRIGSLTKQFTAAAILLLQEQGRLDVDAPITDLLPWYPDPEQDGVPITVHHLLSHTGGVPELFAVLPDPATWPETPRAVVERVAEEPLDFTPGTRFSYSNTGYLLLGLIVEAAAGEPYPAAMRRLIFAPLGMDDTGFEAAGDHRPRPATGYATARPSPALSNIDSPLAIASSAGGMFSTVEDLRRWDRGLLPGGLLSDGSLAAMTKPVEDDYAYGVVVVEVAGHRVHVHSGEIEGFAATLVRLPDDDALVVVLANAQSAPTEAIATTLATVLLG